MLNQVAQDRHVLLAVRSDALLFAGSPPRNGLHAITALGGAQGVFGQLIEFHAMSELFVKVFEHVERTIAERVDRRILAENFQIEPVSVERDDAREGLELGDEICSVRLKPSTETFVPVPGDGNGEPKARNVGPPAFHFVREAQRFYIEVDFVIEQSGRRFFSLSEVAVASSLQANLA